MGTAFAHFQGRGIGIGMNDKDFSDLGKEIGDKINKFVASKEIQDLQENIRMTVEDAMVGVRRSVKEAADQVGKFDSRFLRKNGSGNGWQGQVIVEEDGSRVTDECVLDGAEPGRRFHLAKQKSPVRQLPVVRNPRGRIAGPLMEIFGSCGAVAGWTSAITGAVLAFASIDLFGFGLAGAVSSGLAAVFAGGCTAMAVVGGVWRRRAGRFKKYIRTMGNRDFYSVEGLAHTVQKKEKFVIRDLKKMIGRGWFKEGHLDEQETCFMLTNESYEMYLGAQEQLRLQKEEAERLAREQERLEQDPTQKQLCLIVEEGKEYIRRIRAINDLIAKKDISAKLCRLEGICERIFSHIGEKPEKLPDIRKFMDYYLPTTLKLVEHYYEFSSQPVQGENITTAKREIEEMLDDINGAFEKMFDKLFEEEALDISTDISVLSAMLTQEGLLEDGLKVK